MKMQEYPHWQWLKETPVAILEENELPAWREPSQVLAAVRAMGASLLRYPAIRWGVHSFSESAYLPKYPGLGDRDLFGEILRTMRDNGVKVMAYCHYGVLHSHVAKLHPEWVGKESDGRDARQNGPDHHYRTCMANMQFTFAMRQTIRELCKRYQFDALYLDGPTWYGDCHCDSCRAEYFKHYDEPMPSPLNLSDGSQLKYNLIRDAHCERIVRELREDLADFPSLPLLFNMALKPLKHLPNHPTGIPERTMRWADGGNTTEVHRPGRIWDMLQSIRLGASFGKISMGYLPPGPYDTLRNFPMTELEVLSGAYLMHGSTPMLGTVSTFLNDKSAGGMMSAQVAKFKANPEVYHRGEPVKEIALVYSRVSAENASALRRAPLDNAFGGAFSALLGEHLHFDCLFDTQFTAERLTPYRAIAIPGGISLAPEKLELVREYVCNGGSLLACGDFTLFDADGGMLPDFAAADLLGVNFSNHRPEAPYRSREYRETGPLHGYSLVPEAYLKLKDSRLKAALEGIASDLTPVSDAQVGIPGLKRWIEYNIVKPAPGVEILANLYLPAGGAFGATLEFPFGVPPGITLNRFGRGKVIYAAVPLDEFYEQRNLPETRHLLRELFRILLDGAPVLELEAPAGVIMNLTESASGVYLHLLNYCGGMYEDRRAVEWVAPLDGLCVKFSKRLGKVKALHEIEGGDILRAGENGFFTLKRLKVFATYKLKT
ncbi:MAG: hypothetical protein KJ964_11085 [Verrucomicrobia bacterium]|nr:hypothetical protein [Verrucomicrobiota bacterium]MBU1735302.1 hypothetical protein [Verrucomicrobiota bacterium]MBU1855475.1 hypothetical protein [Verrucomicrobiota bacterium]